jgi:hypothetical protein
MAVEEIKPLLRAIRMGRERYLYGFSKVPDERLNWRPVGHAHTGLELCNRVSTFLYVIHGVIRDGAFPDRTALPAPPDSREEAVALLNSRFDELLATLEGLSEADLERAAPTPWKEQTTVRRWIDNLLGVIGYHQGQLNYFQLCYGDKDPNIPPGFGLDGS